MEGHSLDGGRYAIVEKLGEGATKEVFLARDETLHRDVALCMFKRSMAKGYIERVRREARVLAGLSHPNIVGVYDFREEDSVCYMVTEPVTMTFALPVPVNEPTRALVVTAASAGPDANRRDSSCAMSRMNRPAPETWMRIPQKMSSHR